MLTQSEKDKIKLEETYRNEVVKSLQKKEPRKTFFGKLLVFLNTSFGLWLLSAVFVSGGLKLYQDRKAALEDKRQTNEVLAKLDYEISYRFTRTLVNLYKLTNKDSLLNENYSEKVRATALSLKTSDNYLGDYLYAEYSKFGLLTLLAEEKRALAHLGKSNDDLDKVISDITGLEVFYEVQKIDYSDIRKIAISIEQKLMLPGWKENRFYFLDGNENDPFL